MVKKLLLNFVIILITLFIILSIVWFFKTNAIKKQVLGLISASDGKISAVSISVFGFPFKQKLIVEDLKFYLKTDLLQNLIIPFTDNYHINIKKLEAVSNILSGDFNITNISNISFQSQDGIVNYLHFNQPPQANFVFDNGELIKFFYQDSGYQIKDEGKNILFENGSSLINFESAVKDQKYHNKVKVEFKDIGMFSSAINNIAPVGESLIDIIPSNITQDLNTESSTQKNDSNQPNIPLVEKDDKSIKAINNQQVKNDNIKLPIVDDNKDSLKIDDVSNASLYVNNQPEKNNQTSSNIKSVVQLKNINPVSEILTKRSFALDIEYLVNKSSLSPMEIPVHNIQEEEIIGEENIPSIDESKLESVIINKLEVSSPLYSINFYGKISEFPQDSLPIFSISVQVEKLDNLLILLNEPLQKIGKLANIDNKNIKQIIIDLARQNPTSSNEITVFEFRQEKGEKLLINEISFSEIIARTLPIPDNSNPETTLGNNTENLLESTMPPIINKLEVDKIRTLTDEPFQIDTAVENPTPISTDANQ